MITIDPVIADRARKERAISVILATQGKGKDRTLLQTVILFSETVVVPALATQYGVSFEVAKANFYARNKTYRESVDTESACRAVETGS